MKKTKRRPAKRVYVSDKPCLYCEKKTVPSWRDYEVLATFLSPRSRILSSKLTGICSRHQRKVAMAIKQARHLALLPFVTETV